MFASQAFSLPFLKKQQETENIWSFYFDRTKVPAYDFLAGQYTKVSLPISAKDGKGSYRFFTTASSPLQKEFLMITTTFAKKHMSDFKREFFNLKKRDLVHFEGPLGGFYLDTQDKSPKVFLSGGVGITPFHSMLLFMDQKKILIPITLLAAFSTEKEMIFKNELEAISFKYPNMQINYLTERLSENLIEKYVKGKDKSTFLVSGSPAMVDATYGILEDMGIGESAIKTDIFTGY